MIIEAGGTARIPEFLMSQDHDSDNGRLWQAAERAAMIAVLDVFVTVISNNHEGCNPPLLKQLIEQSRQFQTEWDLKLASLNRS